MSVDAKPTTDATTTPPPAVNGTVPHAPEESRRADEELLRELLELEKQFPPPEKGDDIPDARWFEANEAALYEQYRNEHVAIMNGEVVGHDWNELRLRRDVARKYNVHPQKFLVVYLFSIFG
jgi:hypothetical protein